MPDGRDLNSFGSEEGVAKADWAGSIDLKLMAGPCVLLRAETHYKTVGRRDMQETSKVQDSSSKIQDTSKFPDTTKFQDAAKFQDTPKLQEASKILDLQKVQDISKNYDAQKFQDTPKLRDVPKPTEPVKAQEPPKPEEPSKYREGPKAEAAPKTEEQPPTRGADTMLPSPRGPLLAMAAVVAVLGAAWNYSGREDAVANLGDVRSRLAAVSDELKVVSKAKVDAEAALADMQSKLEVEQSARAAAEQAIANVKAVLAALPVSPTTSGGDAVQGGDAAGDHAAKASSPVDAPAAGVAPGATRPD